MSRLKNAVVVASHLLRLAVFGVATGVVPAVAQTPPGQEQVAAGRAAFNATCSGCHSTTEGGPNLGGPNLFGVVGRDIGSFPGFRYSEALTGFQPGQVWNADLLDQWLTSPGTLVPRTFMQRNVSDAAIRGTIIAYLQSLAAAAPAPGG